MFEKMVDSKNNLVMALALAVVLASAPICMAGDYVLFIEQTPIGGGIITPGTGVHNFVPGQTVTITATPHPGYQFIRWVGDVSVADTSTTTITLDGPKMLMAVFERVEYPIPFMPPADDFGGGSGGGGGGAGRMTAQNFIVGGGGGASPSGSPQFRRTPTWPDNDEIPGNDDIPIPGNPDIPVPIPEPGTLAILALGSGIVLVRRKN